MPVTAHAVAVTLRSRGSLRLVAFPHTAFYGSAQVGFCRGYNISPIPHFDYAVTAHFSVTAVPTHTLTVLPARSASLPLRFPFAFGYCTRLGYYILLVTFTLYRGWTTFAVTYWFTHVAFGLRFATLPRGSRLVVTRSVTIFCLRFWLHCIFAHGYYTLPTPVVAACRMPAFAVAHCVGCYICGLPRFTYDTHTPFTCRLLRLRCRCLRDRSRFLGWLRILRCCYYCHLMPPPCARTPGLCVPVVVCWFRARV